MKVLGIDSSLTGCGLCLLDEDLNKERPVETKIISKTLKNNLKGIERILYIEKEIIAWAKGCELAVIEGYAFDKKFKGESLAELVGVIKRRLHLMGVPLLIVPTQKVKKILTGSGAKPKEYKDIDTKIWTIEKTKDTYGLDFTGRDNECDAFGLAALGMALKRNPKDLMPFEKLVVDEIQNPQMKIKKTLKYYENIPFKVEYEILEDGVKLYCPGLNFEVVGNSKENAYDEYLKQKSARIREMKKKKLKIRDTKKYILEVNDGSL